MAMRYEPDAEANARMGLLAMDGLAELLENGNDNLISGEKIAAILRLVQSPIRDMIERDLNELLGANDGA